MVACVVVVMVKVTLEMTKRGTRGIVGGQERWLEAIT
jgi:hypothetical protein